MKTIRNFLRKVWRGVVACYHTVVNVVVEVAEITAIVIEQDAVEIKNTVKNPLNPWHWLKAIFKVFVAPLFFMVDCVDVWLDRYLTNELKAIYAEREFRRVNYLLPDLTQGA